MALCSIAIAAGVIGALLIVKKLVMRRRFACGRGHGHGLRRGGIGGSYWLRALFSKLDTTPGQEKEIRSAIEDFQKTAKESKESLGASREAIARAVRHEAFDEISIGEASVKVDAAAAQVKNAFEAALRRIHAVLISSSR